MMAKPTRQNCCLVFNHDDDVVVYLNGTKILDKPDYINEYVYLPLSPAGQKALQKGKNVLAVHCVSPRGGSFIDVGIVNPVTTSTLTTATQTGVTVSATQTNYTFIGGSGEPGRQFPVAPVTGVSWR